MTHSAESVANEFLERAEQAGIALTPMHLQKLVYIAHGWALALTNRPLVDDEPQAWRFGPVYPSLYDSLKRFGSGSVRGLIREHNWAGSENRRGEVVRDRFTGPESRIIDKVFTDYAGLEAFQLSALTHADGTPWTTNYVENQNRRIPNAEIGQYFRSIAERGVI